MTASAQRNMMSRWQLVPPRDQVVVDRKSARLTCTEDGRDEIEKASLISLTAGALREIREEYLLSFPKDDRVLKMLESLIRVFFEARGAKRFSLRDWGRMVRSFGHVACSIITIRDFGISIEYPDLEQDFVKYHCAKMACCGFQHVGDLPPMPKKLIGTQHEALRLFTGWSLHFAMRAAVRQDVGFFQGLLMAKRVWPLLGETRRRFALWEHAELICGTPEQELDEPTRSSLERASKRVFARLPDPTKFMPTGRACLQFSMKAGGSLSCAAALDLQHLDQFFDGLHSRRLQKLQERIGQWRQTEYRKIVQTTHRELRDPKKNARLQRVLVQAIPEPAKFRIITAGNGYLMTAIQPAQGQLLTCWKQQRECTMEMSDDDLHSRVSQMKRALPFETFRWLSIDYKSSTDFLSPASTKAAFSAANGRVHNSDLAWLSLLGAELWYPEKEFDPNWDARTTRLSAEAFDERFSDSFFRVTGHRKEDPAEPWNVTDQFPRFTPPTRKSTFIGGFRQSSGQLMGHPLSFPLLCVINTAVYESAVDEFCGSFSWHDLSSDALEVAIWYDQVVLGNEQTKLDFRSVAYRSRFLRALERDVIRGECDRRLGSAVKTRMLQHHLVNGDDALFRGNSRFELIFWQHAARVGFRPSVGKTYASSLMAMINNVLFKDVGTHVERCGYLNQAILEGYTPKKTSAPATPDQLGKDLNKMFSLRKNSSGYLPLCFRKWEKFHRGFYKPNWFLPVHLGGYGVAPRFADPDHQRILRRFGRDFILPKLSRSQLALAQAFVEDETLGALFERAQGLVIPVRLIIQFLPHSRLDWPTAEEALVDDDWTARLAYAYRASLCGTLNDSREVILGLEGTGEYFSALNRLPGPTQLIGRYGHVHHWTVSDLAMFWSAQRVRFPGCNCPPQEILGGNILERNTESVRFSIGRSSRHFASGNLLASGPTWAKGVRGGREHFPHAQNS